MRCLYCGIKLKIAKKAEVIGLCPECSVRIECEVALEEAFPGSTTVKP